MVGKLLKFRPQRSVSRTENPRAGPGSPAGSILSLGTIRNSIGAKLLVLAECAPNCRHCRHPGRAPTRLPDRFCPWAPFVFKALADILRFPNLQVVTVVCHPTDWRIPEDGHRPDVRFSISFDKTTNHLASSTLASSCLSVRARTPICA